MKAILTFDLPEEDTEFNEAIEGYKWKVVVLSLDEYLRQQNKYCDRPTEARNFIEEVREEIRETLSTYGLTFE
jgi:hypothetical protein